MRERIKVELSDFFREEILLPAIIKEYEVGLNEMILLNEAYAIMLAKERIIDEETGILILRGLEQVKNELRPETLDARNECLYFNIEQALFKKIGVKIGGKLHTGRSRNDVYATLGRMEVRRSLWEVLKRVITLQEILVKIASQNMDTVITGYTHMQPAQPITLAHYYTAASNAFNRDFERLKNAYRTTNVCPYGATALAGTGFPINRQLLSDLLGFEKVLTNSLDGVGARDYILEVESAFAIMAVNISRIAQDLYIWCSDEYGILDLGGEIAISSSIMPQKKNPASLELAKAKAAHSMGALTSTFAVLKNTPFSLCMDLFEAPGMYWEAHSQVLQSIGLLSESIKYSTINKEKALERARRNFSTVTALADYLVTKFDISFTEAHSIVGIMVAKAVDDDSSMDGMKTPLLKEASNNVLGKELEVSDEEIQRVFEPHRNVQSKKIIGGPSRESVEKMLSDTNKYMKAEKIWLKMEINRVERAFEKVRKGIPLVT